MNLATRQLTRDELWQQVEAITGMLLARGITDGTVEFGWGCKIDTSELWEPMTVNLADLLQFVKDGERVEKCRLGTGDIIVSVGRGSFEVLFSHESDVRVSTENTEFARRWVEFCRANRIEVYRKGDAGEWQPVEDGGRMRSED